MRRAAWRGITLVVALLAGVPDGVAAPEGVALPERQAALSAPCGEARQPCRKEHGPVGPWPGPLMAIFVAPIALTVALPGYSLCVMVDACMGY